MKFLKLNLKWKKPQKTLVCILKKVQQSGLMPIAMGLKRNWDINNLASFCSTWDLPLNGKSDKKNVKYLLLILGKNKPSLPIKTVWLSEHNFLKCLESYMGLLCT